jgi:hypothetical protein
VLAIMVIIFMHFLATKKLRWAVERCVRWFVCIWTLLPYNIVCRNMKFGSVCFMLFLWHPKKDPDSYHRPTWWSPVLDQHNHWCAEPCWWSDISQFGLYNRHFQLYIVS